MTQENLDNWDGFLGANFLMAEHVRDENHEFVCVKVDLDNENNRPLLFLESEDLKKMFSLNVTNSKFCKKENIKSPKDLIDKKLTFRKVVVTSPKTKEEVDSLRIKTIV